MDWLKEKLYVFKFYFNKYILRYKYHIGVDYASDKKDKSVIAIFRIKNRKSILEKVIYK